MERHLRHWIVGLVMLAISSAPVIGVGLAAPSTTAAAVPPGPVLHLPAGHPGSLTDWPAVDAATTAALAGPGPAAVGNLSAAWDHLDREVEVAWHLPEEDGGSELKFVRVQVDGESIGELTPVTSGAVISGMPAGRHLVGIAVGDAFSAVGPVVEVPVVVAGAPANDPLASAHRLEGGHGSVWGTTWGATPESTDARPAQSPWPGAGGASVWFTWTAPHSGPVRLRATSHDSETNPAIGVYTSGPGGLAPPPGSTVAEWQGRSRAFFDAAGGTTYLIAVDGFPDSSTGTGLFDLDWELDDGPVGTTTTLATAVDARRVTLTATVVSGAGQPSGTVTFRDGAVVVGTAPATGGGAEVTLTAVTRGPHSYTARFVPTDEATFETSSSPARPVVVAPAATTTTVGTQVEGERVTVRIRVTSGDGVPVGTVGVVDGATPVGSAELVNGAAAVVVDGVARGEHRYRVEFAPEDPVQHAASSSGPWTVTIRPGVPAPTPSATTTSMVASLTGSTVRLAASVAGAVAPTGSVRFEDGATLLGTVTVGSGGHAALVLADVRPGTHLYRATFVPATTAQLGSLSPPRVLTVAAPAVASRTTVSTPRTARAGTRPRVQVTVRRGSAYATGSVVLRYGGRRVTAMMRHGRATIRLAGLRPGRLRLKASYAGNATTRASSATTTITVTRRT